MKTVRLALVFGLLTLTASIAQAAPYIYTIIVHPKATLGTWANGINDNDQVTGFFSDGSQNFHSFLNTGGTYTPIDHPGATGGTKANDINESGQVTGVFFNASGAHGFIYSGGVNGVYTTIDFPNAPKGTWPSAINDIGQVTGWFFDDSNIAHGFIYKSGNFTPLNLFNINGSIFPEGINNSGQVTGFFYSDTGIHGFVYKGGAYTILDHPGAIRDTSAEGINNRGDVVGSFTDSAGPHGFIYSDGAYTTLDVPTKMHNAFAYDINDNGQVAGVFLNDRVIYGFMASPLFINMPGLTLNGSSLTIRLTAGDNTGKGADWWFVAMTPWGHWFSYIYPNRWVDIGTDLSRVSPAYQGPLIDISGLGLFDITGLSSGNYVFYFGVDNNMNGQLDYDQLVYSSLSVRAP